MPRYKIKIESPEMLRVKRYVMFMSKFVKFDDNLLDVNWKDFRRKTNFFYRHMGVEKGVKLQRTNLGSIPVLRYDPKNIQEGHIFIYTHGGAFVTGSAYDIRSYCSHLVKASGYTLYSIEYSLAPEHPYPTAVNECSEAVEQAMKLHPDAKITLVGDSAGGNLAAALAYKYKDSGRIASVILHSPTLDFAGVVDHSINEINDPIVGKRVGKALLKMYIGDNDRKDPMISPIVGDFTNYPPAFITCDINETLYADAVAIYEKCEANNIPAVLVESEGGFHTFATAGNHAPETEGILKDTLAFINENR